MEEQETMPSRSLHCPAPPTRFGAQRASPSALGHLPTSHHVHLLWVPYFRPSLGPTSGGLKFQPPGSSVLSLTEDPAHGGFGDTERSVWLGYNIAVVNTLHKVGTRGLRDCHHFPPRRPPSSFRKSPSSFRKPLFSLSVPLDARLW